MQRVCTRLGALAKAGPDVLAFCQIGPATAGAEGACGSGKPEIGPHTVRERASKMASKLRRSSTMQVAAQLSSQNPPCGNPLHTRAALARMEATVRPNSGVRFPSLDRADERFSLTEIAPRLSSRARAQVRASECPEASSHLGRASAWAMIAASLSMAAATSAMDDETWYAVARQIGLGATGELLCDMAFLPRPGETGIPAWDRGCRRRRKTKCTNSAVAAN